MLSKVSEEAVVVPPLNSYSYSSSTTTTAAIHDATLITRRVEIDEKMAGHRPSCSSTESGYASEPDTVVDDVFNSLEELSSIPSVYNVISVVSVLPHSHCQVFSLQVKKYIRSNHWPVGSRIRAELWKELCKDSERGGRISLYREKIDQLVASGGTF